MTLLVTIFPLLVQFFSATFTLVLERVVVTSFKFLFIVSFSVNFSLFKFISMLFYFSIYSLVAIICVQNFLSGREVHRLSRSTDAKHYDLAVPGWTIEKLANVPLDLWPWNCLDSEYSDFSLREAISIVCSNVHDAASKGYIGFFQYYVEKRKMSINERKEDKDGETPLHLAVQNGHLNIVKYIASKLTSVDLNTYNKNHCTPVMYAASYGRLDILKFLLYEAKADFNSHIEYQNLVLRSAARGGHLSVLKYLIDERHYPVNCEDRDLFYAAASGGNVDLIKYLVYEKKLKTFFPDGDCHNWALHRAASTGSLAAMKFLIDNLGYDVNLRSKDGTTPVHAAAEGGSLLAVKYLIEEKGTDVNVRSYLGFTPLHLASFHGHLSVVKYLVDEQHVWVDGKDNSGRTPVYQAVHENKMDVVKFLLGERNADKKVKACDGRTLLHEAVYSGNVGMMRYLVDELKMQALIDEMDTSQCTATCHAASEGQLDILKYLIDEKHSNIRIVDWEGKNLLEAAAGSCKLSIVKYLVDEKGFNVNYTSLSGMSVFSYATRCQYDKIEMMQYLTQKMLKNSLSQTPAPLSEGCETTEEKVDTWLEPIFLTTERILYRAVTLT